MKFLHMTFLDILICVDIIWFILTYNKLYKNKHTFVLEAISIALLMHRKDELGSFLFRTSQNSSIDMSYNIIPMEDIIECMIYISVVYN